MTRVFIIADSPIMQAGLEAIVTEAKLSVIGVDRLTGEWQRQALAVEVVLVSAELSEENLNLLASLLLEPTAPAIVWLIDTLPDLPITAALQLGILGILPNDATSEEIVAALAAATAGLVVLHPDIANLFIQANLRSPLAPATQALTQREIEIMQMLAEGMANKTIARHLHISEHTVKFHLSSIFAKLNVSSRTEAVTIGIRQGLILV